MGEQAGLLGAGRDAAFEYDAGVGLAGAIRSTLPDCVKVK